MLSDNTRREIIDNAREMILDALEIIQEAVKDTGLENTVRERIIKVIEPVVVYADPVKDLENEVFGIDTLLEMIISEKTSEKSGISRSSLMNIPEDLQLTTNLDAYDD